MALAAKIPANEYSLGDGRGYINIWPVRDGSQAFLIHNDGPNGATCGLKGVLRDNKGKVGSPENQIYAYCALPRQGCCQ